MLREIRERGTWISAIVLLALIFFLAAAAISCWGETAPWRISSEEQLESNIQRFDWATPECVEQEIRNPEYRNNDEKLRLCQLENRILEIEQQLDTAP